MATRTLTRQRELPGACALKINQVWLSEFVESDDVPIYSKVLSAPEARKLAEELMRAADVADGGEVSYLFMNPNVAELQFNAICQLHVGEASHD